MKNHNNAGIDHELEKDYDADGRGWDEKDEDEGGDYREVDDHPSYDMDSTDLDTADLTFFFFETPAVSERIDM